MKNEQIRDAWNRANPTSAQKRRIWEAILDRLDAAPGEYRAAPQTHRKGAWIPGAAALLAVAFIGILVLVPLRGQGEPVAHGTDPTEPTGEETTEQFQTIQPDCETILQTYVTAVRENWDGEACMQNQISLMVSYAAAKDSFGYARMDMDGDGIDELLITDGDVIFDFYTYRDGDWKQLFTGWERNFYRLGENNVIIHVGARSAASTLYTYSQLRDGALEVLACYSFDAARDEMAPWYRGDTESDHAVAISEEDFDAAIHAYHPVEIPFVPLSSLQQEKTEPQEAKTVHPLPGDMSLEGIENGTYFAGFTASDLAEQADGTVTLQVMLYQVEQFDGAQIAELAVGDTLVLRGEAVIIESLEWDQELLILNGGYDLGGYILTSNDQRTYYEIKQLDSKDYVPLGKTTLEVAQSCDFHNVTLGGGDNGRDNAVYFLEFAMGKRLLFGAHETSVTVRDGKIVCVVRTEAENEKGLSTRDEDEQLLQTVIRSCIVDVDSRHPLYYAKADINGDGVIDLILGSREAWETVWTVTEDEDLGVRKLDHLNLSEDGQKELDIAWPNMDIRPITEYPVN